MECRAASLVLAMLGTGVSADFDPEAYPRHETCALCHGLFGTSHIGKFPNLGAQDPTYLTQQLQSFIAGERTNDGGQMASVVLELQPGDLEQVVEWFSTQDPPEPATVPDTSAGAALYDNLGCGGCHDNVSDMPGVPYITAQKAQYLSKQMSDFSSGDRQARNGFDHQSILMVTEDEMEALSLFLSAEPRK